MLEIIKSIIGIGKSKEEKKRERKAVVNFTKGIIAESVKEDRESFLNEKVEEFSGQSMRSVKYAYKYLYAKNYSITFNEVLNIANDIFEDRVGERELEYDKLFSKYFFRLPALASELYNEFKYEKVKDIVFVLNAIVFSDNIFSPWVVNMKLPDDEFSYEEERTIEKLLSQDKFSIIKEFSKVRRDIRSFKFNETNYLPIATKDIFGNMDSKISKDGLTGLNNIIKNEIKE